MCTAAGDHLKVAHCNDPHMLTDRRCLAQGQFLQFFFLRKPAADRRVQADARVHRILQEDDLFFGQVRSLFRHGDIDAGIRLAQMQSDRRSAELLPDRAGQHMLAAVLFHVVRPPLAVDLPVHSGTCRNLLIHRMPDFSVAVGFHFRDACLHFSEGKRPGIERLAAGGRVKRASVECNLPLARPCPVLHRSHCRVKCPQIGIVVIQSFRHVFPLAHTCQSLRFMNYELVNLNHPFRVETLVKLLRCQEAELQAGFPQALAFRKSLMGSLCRVFIPDSRRQGRNQHQGALHILPMDSASSLALCRKL